MLIRLINTGSDLVSIINGTPDGKEVKYLIPDNPTKEIERIVKFANNKLSLGIETFIKVKYEWALGQRARVLEIVTRDGEKLTIYKFVNDRNFDQHLLDLERIKDSIIEDENYRNSEIQLGFIAKDEKTKEKIEELVSEMGSNIIVENI